MSLNEPTLLTLQYTNKCIKDKMCERWSWWGDRQRVTNSAQLIRFSRSNSFCMRAKGVHFFTKCNADLYASPLPLVISPQQRYTYNIFHLTSTRPYNSSSAWDSPTYNTQMLLLPTLMQHLPVIFLSYQKRRVRQLVFYSSNFVVVAFYNAIYAYYIVE